MPESAPPPCPIAVFVHVHYPAVWDGMARRLAQTLRRPFQLIVTTSNLDVTSLSLPETPYLIGHRIIQSENRGRDILPFLGALREAGNFTIGLKLHTKQSVHRLDGNGWGEMLVNALLPSPEATSQLLSAMASDPRLALVGPDGMLVSMAPWMLQNARLMRLASERLGLSYPEAIERTPVFCAGAMFWFQRTALLPVNLADLDDLFEDERGQVDGTAAHALERLFSPVAESSGGVVTTMNGSIRSQPDMTLEALRALSRQMTDQPNAFLVQLPKYARILLGIPGVRRVYQALPNSVRNSVRRFRA